MPSEEPVGAVGAPYDLEAELRRSPYMKYRKKPVIIDAWLIKNIVDAYFGLGCLNEHVSNAIEVRRLKPVLNGIHIDTLEGGMFGRLEDYLIRGVAGEFYPCKPDIFLATYEPVTP